ncbi:hypothetical protein PHYPSEUDO_008611 [Phytophthora pseudosyringae]|uniref:Uncharacterized protein n=1 Tax=Phytophthora pseudosyringae TaxID=221518 RepID=A0A8T1W9E6_9STRA|nr:hypothetical protein PHYPSEUDO_008611 [Phytophthora pseudosyringae]
MASVPLTNPRSKLSWKLIVTAVMGVVLVVTQLATYKPHFDAHMAKHRILRRLQEQPALRLSLKLKRKSMYVHGASAFDVIATPSLKQLPGRDSLVYDGMAVFKQDGEKHEYSLVDGTAYYTKHSVGQNATKSGCLPSSFVPPIETVLSAIDTAYTATHLVDSGLAEVACQRGTLMAFAFAGENYLLCAPHMHNEGFTVMGEDLDIHVRYEDAAPVIVAPSIPSDVEEYCGKVPLSETLRPSPVSLLHRSFSEWGHRVLRAQEAESWVPSIVSKVASAVTGDSDGTTSHSSCSTTPRPCVFVAGLGQKTDYGLSTTDSKPYFGDKFQDYVPCCSSVQYIELATSLYAWYDLTLVNELVGYLFEISSSSNSNTKVISDTIIFAHSSANLMLAYAISQNLCSLDSTTTWLGASAPMMGSMGSDFIQKACDGTLTGVVSSLFELLDDCPVTAGRISLSYETESYASPELKAAYAAAQTAYAANVDAVMCSNGYSGLSSTYAAVYVLAGTVIPHKSSENDGLVEYQSCAYGLDTSTFSSSYTSKNYVTKLNHQDASLRNGDSLFSDAKKPLKWIQNLLS